MHGSGGISWDKSVEKTKGMYVDVLLDGLEHYSVEKRRECGEMLLYIAQGSRDPCC